MKITYLKNIDSTNNIIKGGVFAIGNFDGVHKGHKLIIEHTASLAKQLKIDNNWGIITFSPNTKLWFANNQKKDYEILTTEQQKLDHFKRLGVPRVIIINFENIYNLLAKDFIEKYLIKILDIKAIVTGKHARFGSDLTFVREIINNYFISHYENELLANNNEIYSSSIIKENIKQGEIKKSNLMLDYNFNIKATVIHGQKLGRKIGFPTANLVISPYVRPKYGIYATRVCIPNDHKIYNSVSNFGIRPTIKNSDYKELLEVHIFNFDDNIYGKEITVEFIDYIRSEEKFNGIDELVKQIKLDVISSQEILSHLK